MITSQWNTVLSHKPFLLAVYKVTPFRHTNRHPKRHAETPKRTPVAPRQLHTGAALQGFRHHLAEVIGVSQQF